MKSQLTKYLVTVLKLCANGKSVNDDKSMKILFHLGMVKAIFNTSLAKIKPYLKFIFRHCGGLRRGGFSQDTVSSAHY